jgi:hypothetical protein
VLINEVPPRSIPPSQNDPVTLDVDLLLNGTLAQIAGAPAQQPSQIIDISSHQPNRPHEISPLSEERFKAVLMYFTTYTGFGLCERDLIIEGKAVSPLALHKAVFLQNGFESVGHTTISYVISNKYLR